MAIFIMQVIRRCATVGKLILGLVFVTFYTPVVRQVCDCSKKVDLLFNYTGSKLVYFLDLALNRQRPLKVTVIKLACVDCTAC